MHSFSDFFLFIIIPYRILLKKSGSRTPRVELEDMGPSLDLVMRRTKLASDDLFRRALKQPKTAKVCRFFPSTLPFCNMYNDIYINMYKIYEHLYKM